GLILLNGVKATYQKLGGKRFRVQDKESVETLLEFFRENHPFVFMITGNRFRLYEIFKLYGFGVFHTQLMPYILLSPDRDRAEWYEEFSNPLYNAHLFFYDYLEYFEHNPDFLSRYLSVLARMYGSALENHLDEFALQFDIPPTRVKRIYYRCRGKLLKDIKKLREERKMRITELPISIRRSLLENMPYLKDNEIEKLYGINPRDAKNFYHFTQRNAHLKLQNGLPVNELEVIVISQSVKT
ncbi:MAG: hypothetical protein NZL93_06800, partial [Chthoniobacterales bacterium]|nr:hypothetical protein [Chthoniobacterales bacterium]